MNEEERRRFESLESLRRAAYESFDSRRSYEWKLSLGIWTAQALALVALLQPTGEDFPLKTHWAVLWGALVGVALVCLHGFLSHGFAKANANDKAESRHFMDAMVEKAMLKRSEFPFPRWDEGTPGWRKWWSHLGQIGITCMLAVAAVLIIWGRS
jgi:hypothetical protein